MRPTSSLLLAFLLLAPALPGGAATLRALDDVQQAALADHVVVARVTGQRVEQHPRLDLPVTRTALQVEESLRGPAASELVLSQIGGTLGDVTVRVPGSPELEVGGRYVLFLEEVQGDLVLVALERSAYRVERSRFGELLRRVGEHRAPGEDGAKPARTLKELRRQLAASPEPTPGTEVTP